MDTLILSEATDKSTDIACAWLQYLKHGYIRLNSEEFHNPKLIVHLSNGSLSIKIETKSKKVDFSEIKKIWFRRGYLYTYSSYKLPAQYADTVKDLNYHLENEGKTLQDFLVDVLSAKQKINHPEFYNFNKLIALHEAALVGLKIPNTIVSNDASVIHDFVSDSNGCITKSIQDISPVRVGNVQTTTGKIAQVVPDDITEDSYWYSLFQKEIPKKYELRVFYFLGKMYAMAIFSQLDKQSKLDFRDVDVNGSHPNRMVPYILPKEIKTKLRRLMKKLNLESGSIDIIVTPDNDYIFLEVNPVGQFNFVSDLCNYYIEKDIAKFLAQ